jgi:hypothetical protein
MSKYVSFLLLILIVACKIQPESNREYDEFDPDKTYKLQLNPAQGSVYYYEISNESKVNLEIDDKEIHNLTETNVGIQYNIDKDSTGHYQFTMRYDKLKLHTKNGDQEMTADASNAALSLNPIEKMLGVLKEGLIMVTISPSGKIESVNGYDEIGDKIMASFADNDVNGKKVAQSQWEKVIGEGLIKNNMDQLFNIFPDSAVHLKDTWKLSSKQSGEFTMNVTGTFTLKAINSDFAVIESHGFISSNNTATNVMGYGNVTTNLKGEQEGEFEMEAKTGMLISCRIKAKTEGTIQILGREVPVTINNEVTMKGKKLR